MALRRRARGTRWWIALVLATLSGGVAQAGEGGGFRLVDLGPGITSITGLSEVPVGGQGVTVVGNRGWVDTRAFMWRDGRSTDLHALLHHDPKQPNKASFATGVGTGVVGYKTSGVRRAESGFWFVNGVMHDLSQSRPYHRTRITAINSQGELAFSFRIGTPSSLRRLSKGAFYGGSWPIAGDQWLPLPRLGKGRTVAHDLLTDLTGNHAEFAGVSENARRRERAVRGDARTGDIRDLGTLDGREPTRRSAALALNQVGQVVGWSEARSADDGVTQRPCLWDGSGRIVELARVPHPRYPWQTWRDPIAYRDARGRAVDVNRRGFAVGVVGTGDSRDHDFHQRGTLWVIGPPGERSLPAMRRIDLGQVLPPGCGFEEVLEAMKINDAGWIAATAAGTSHERQHAVLLVPRQGAARAPRPPTLLKVRPSDKRWGARSAGAIYCRACHVKRRRPGRFPSGADGAITAVLFLCALPVAAPGLLFLWLGAKRWGRLDLVHGFGWDAGSTTWLLVLSAVLGTVFFVRELAKGRYPFR